MSKMKYSGVEWIGDIPNEWNICKVKNFFKSHKRIVGNKYENYNRISLTLNGVVIRDKDDTNGLQPEDFTGYQIVNKEDYIFKLIDLNNVKTSRIGKSEYNGITSPAYILLNYKFNNNYPLYYFLNMWYQEIFNNLGNIGVRSALNKDDLINVEFIEIPLKKEQQLIADFLEKKIGCLDRIIEDLNKQIEILNKYKYSKITEIISNGVNKKQKYLICRLGLYTFVTKISGFEYTDIMADNLSSDGVIPIVRAQNVRMLKFDCNINEYIDEKTSIKLNRCALDKKCILLTFIGAGIGDVCIFDEKKRYQLAPNVAKIEILNKNKFIEEYIMYYFASEFGKNEIFNITKASAQPSLSMETIRRLKIFIPPIDEQKEIVEYLNKKCDQIDKIIEDKQKQIEKIEEYKKSVIYEYVTGKKRVEGAEELYG